MRESRLYGSVRGALSNERPYRDPALASAQPLACIPRNGAGEGMIAQGHF